MLTKAIVEEVINEYSARIRIPIYDKINSSSFATRVEDLPTAIICVPPGFKYALKKGEVVIVGFEQNRTGNPIILGVLSREENKSSTNIISESLSVNVNCSLPEDTKIQNLDNTQLLTYIQDLEKRIKSLEEKLINEEEV